MPFLVKDLLVLTCWRGGFKGHQSIGVWNTIFSLCGTFGRSIILGLLKGLNPPLLKLNFFFHRLLFDCLKEHWGS